jgi:hypothetical protein
MTRSRLCSICFYSLFVVGCAGQVDDGAQTEAGLARRPPGSVTTLVAAFPDISWQFYSCITEDQRTGLILAMQDLLTRDDDLAAVMQGAIGESLCINGEERGGLFRPSTFGDRNKGLASIAIRAPAKRYAFSAGDSLMQDIAAREAARYPRFDAHGLASAQGRFAVLSITAHAGQGTTVNVVDTTNNRTAQLPTVPHLAAAGSYINCIEYLLPAFPSSDPLVQTVVNAGNLYFSNLGDFASQKEFLSPTCVAAFALDVPEQPSLIGWIKSLDDIDYAAAETDDVLIVSGSNNDDLIQ